MTTIGTLFSGGEGVGVGARQAGLEHLWGVEWDDDIASVARMNGFNTLTGDVRDVVLMRSLPRPDVIHASPVCKNASNAKADGEESPLDIETADAVCAYINHFKPDIFTLENVWGYRIFTAFAHIIEALNANKYHVDYWHLNAANYGVPQTRQRLILVARLNGKPRKPLATHARPDKLTPMFDTRLPWIGWYAAIEDLIDTLPESKFAPWQLERLPKELIGTVTCNSAYLVDQLNAGNRGSMKQPTIRNAVDPSITIGVFSPKHPAPRAFIPPFVNADGTAHERNDDEPIHTIQGTAYKQTPKAFIVNNQASDDHHGGTYGITVREDVSPSVVITNGFIPKAFIVGDQKRQTVYADEPAQTVMADKQGSKSGRAWLSQGHVVKMTPRAIARFQSFPDSYILPDKAKLACTVIGNAVPPLLYQRVIEAQL